MKNIIVATKVELKIALKNKVEEIIVVGELADKLHKAKKISSLSKKALIIVSATIGAGIALAPVSGGASLGISAISAAGYAAVGTAGFGTAAIIAASSLGIALILAVYKDYEEISYENGKLTIKKHDK